ncbi:hypothetical protein [Azospirillum sp. Sh1]|uniref:hypothetical protein n=1 Tax=Azospirillum sp. Sh1 TaxID=2607285 RepID=UPI0011F08901|nr:hypothetical protein [Azospirillum sp. Sh1]KAA0579387.1 hypothetical protein FZ029_08135 [Azospirillum sp. Sh1]
MTEIERLIITLPAALQRQEFASLKADIDRGMTDLAERRLTDFDAERIAEQGKAFSARSRST